MILKLLWSLYFLSSCCAELSCFLMFVEQIFRTNAHMNTDSISCIAVKQNQYSLKHSNEVMLSKNQDQKRYTRKQNNGSMKILPLFVVFGGNFFICVLCPFLYLTNSDAISAGINGASSPLWGRLLCSCVNWVYPSIWNCFPEWKFCPLNTDQTKCRILSSGSDKVFYQYVSDVNGKTIKWNCSTQK